MIDPKKFAERGFALEPSNSFGYLVRDTSRLMLRALAVDLEKHGVTIGQYFVLRELWENDGATPSELSTRMGILEPSTNSALDALERRALITRVRSESDRRRVHVHVTPEGRDLRGRLLQYAAKVTTRALEGVSNEDIDRVRDVLRRVKMNLSED